MNWESLIVEHDGWVCENFPETNTPMWSAMGVVEEMGELAHARLKMEQGIRGDYDKHELEAIDAVGDMTIYLLGVMVAIGPMPRIGGWETENGTRALFALSHAVGQLSACFERSEETKHNKVTEYTTGRIIWYLQEFCRHEGWDYEEIVVDTWTAVKKRNWVAHPTNGVDE